MMMMKKRQGDSERPINDKEQKKKKHFCSFSFFAFICDHREHYGAIQDTFLCTLIFSNFSVWSSSHLKHTPDGEKEERASK